MNIQECIFTNTISVLKILNEKLSAISKKTESDFILQRIPIFLPHMLLYYCMLSYVVSYLVYTHHYSFVQDSKKKCEPEKGLTFCGFQTNPTSSIETEILNLYPGNYIAIVFSVFVLFILRRLWCRKIIIHGTQWISKKVLLILRA